MAASYAHSGCAGRQREAALVLRQAGTIGPRRAQQRQAGSGLHLLARRGKTATKVRGPIARQFLGPDRTKLIQDAGRAGWGPKTGDADVLRMRPDEKPLAEKIGGESCAYQGSARSCDLLDRSRTSFKLLLDRRFPDVSKWNEATDKKIDFSPTIRFSMPQGGLEALEGGEPLDGPGLSSTISSVTAIELSLGRDPEPPPGHYADKPFEIAGYSMPDVVEARVLGVC